MDNTFYIICLLITIFATINSQEISDVTIDNDVVNKGSDVTVSCYVRDIEVGTTIFWWKRQSDQMLQMGTNDMMNQIFDTTGRYHVSINDEGDEPAFVLHIMSAEAEDSGEIGCSVPKSSPDPLFVTLHVVVPVEELTFSSMEEDGTIVYQYTDGMVVPFNEGDVHHFQCEASGSNPAPTITMTLGDHDVTEYFDIVDTHEVTGGQPGLQHIHYRTIATTHTAVHVAGYANAYDFRCTTVVPYVDDVSIGITPSLKFPPTLDCDERQVAELYEENVEVVCKAKANPFIKFESVHWYQKDESNITLTSEASKSGHNTFLVEEGETEDQKILTLRIDRAHPQAFRSYTFIVRNELGEKNRTVVLARDDSGESSVAGNQQVSLLSIVTSCLMAYILH